MAAEEFRPHAVETRERAGRLLIDFEIPRLASGPHQEELVEESVLDGPLQRMRFVQAGLLSIFVHLPGRAALLQRYLPIGVDLQNLSVDPELPGAPGFAKG